jgi:hypothetical protein
MDYNSKIAEIKFIEDVEIVAEKFKKYFSNYCITVLEKRFSLFFDRPRYVRDVVSTFVVDLGTKEYDLLISFFGISLLKEKSIQVTIIENYSPFFSRIDKVKKPNGIYYKGIKKLANELINSNSSNLICSFSQQYKDINLDTGVLSSFVKYVVSHKDKMDERIFSEIYEEITKPKFYDSGILKCNSAVIIKLDQLF